MVDKFHKIFTGPCFFSPVIVGLSMFYLNIGLGQCYYVLSFVTDDFIGLEALRISIKCTGKFGLLGTLGIRGSVTSWFSPILKTVFFPESSHQVLFGLFVFVSLTRLYFLSGVLYYT